MDPNAMKAQIIKLFGFDGLDQPEQDKSAGEMVEELLGRIVQMATEEMTIENAEKLSDMLDVEPIDFEGIFAHIAASVEDLPSISKKALTGLYADYTTALAQETDRYQAQQMVKQAEAAQDQSKA